MGAAIEGILYIYGHNAGAITGGHLNAKERILTVTGEFKRYWVSAGITQATAEITFVMPKGRTMKAPEGMPRGAPTRTFTGKIREFTVEKLVMEYAADQPAEGAPLAETEGAATNGNTETNA